MTIAHIVNEETTAPARPRKEIAPEVKELSPVARNMMSDLRQQRMRARQVERRRGVWVAVHE